MQISNATALGGIRKHMHDILRNIDSQQFKQSYACTNLVFDTTFAHEIVEIKKQIFKVLLLPIKRKPSLTDITNLLRLIKYIKKEQVDIVHGHGAKGGLYARLLSVNCGVKAIYTPHGGTIHSMYNPLINKTYLLIEKVLLRFTDYLLFESQYSATMFYKKVGDFRHLSRVNYNGIAPPDIEYIKRKSISLGYVTAPHDELQLGLFGVLRKEKGQIYAIKAVAELKQQSKIVHLHVFGKGDEQNRLEKLAIKLGVKEQVTFHGEVVGVEPHIYAMDIILIPSLFESLGYIALEAISLKKWVIASNLGGLPEVIDHGVNGFLIKERNASEIAKAILSIADPVLKKKKISNGLNQQKFGLEQMIANIEQVYSWMMAKNEIFYLH